MGGSWMSPPVLLAALRPTSTPSLCRPLCLRVTSTMNALSTNRRASMSDFNDANRDPLTNEPGAHPVGTGVGAAMGGAAAGAAAGAFGGPVGAAVGGVAGAVVGGL